MFSLLGVTEPDYWAKIQKNKFIAQTHSTLQIFSPWKLRAQENINLIDLAFLQFDLNWINSRIISIILLVGFIILLDNNASYTLYYWIQSKTILFDIRRRWPIEPLQDLNLSIQTIVQAGSEINWILKKSIVVDTFWIPYLCHYARSLYFPTNFLRMHCVQYFK